MKTEKKNEMCIEQEALAIFKNNSSSEVYSYLSQNHFAIFHKLLEYTCQNNNLSLFKELEKFCPKEQVQKETFLYSPSLTYIYRYDSTDIFEYVLNNLTHKAHQATFFMHAIEKDAYNILGLYLSGKLTSDIELMHSWIQRAKKDKLISGKAQIAFEKYDLNFSITPSLRNKDKTINKL